MQSSRKYFSSFVNFSARRTFALVLFQIYSSELVRTDCLQFSRVSVTRYRRIQRREFDRKWGVCSTFLNPQNPSLLSLVSLVAHVDDEARARGRYCRCRDFPWITRNGEFVLRGSKRREKNSVAKRLATLKSEANELCIEYERQYTCWNERPTTAIVLM